MLMDYFIVCNNDIGLAFSVVTLSCLCAASDETPGDAARRGAKKGIIMQPLA